MKSSGLFSLLVLPLVVPAISLSAMFAQNLSSITPAQIEAVAPKSKSCSDADLPDECATSKQAAPAIAHSFTIYKVASRAEQAAVIGLMAFESAEFQYSRNQYHGVPGQGTRNMQSPTFNLKYAESIPALKDQVASVRGDPVQVLDLLLTKTEYDFGSGAWFLTSQCDRGVRTALQSGSEEGWARFISSCVGTDANKERRAYWRAAVEALR